MKKIIEFIIKLFKKDNICLFLGSTDILPPPLSNEDEIKYLTLAKEGDISARNKLIEHNIRLVVFLAKKYDNTGEDLLKMINKAVAVAKKDGVAIAICHPYKSTFEALKIAQKDAFKGVEVVYVDKIYEHYK